VPSMTFCASVQAIRACGAQPRFAEVDPSSLCMTSSNVMDALTPNMTAVMPVHYGGRATDLSDIHPAMAERNIQIVEDAAHSFGSFAGTTRVGSVTGLVTCFSFGPIKNLTCGQGGAIMPRNAKEAQRARHMRLVGMVESPAERARSTAYRVDGFGLRAHMSQLNAAIGLAQLPNFPQAARQRKLLWRAYAAALEDVPGVSLVDVDVEHSVPHLCTVLVPHRDAVFRALHNDGIGVGTHYPPNHLQDAFVTWRRPLPVSEQLGEEILTLPFHQRMSTDDVSVVVTALDKALR
jgi:dTDP-4-amino-4,6-dideoxygalactose transaminase